MMKIQGPWIKDENGRTLILRGVNLSGSSKVPYKPNGATYIRENFFDHRNVSFVGRPFPLTEADEHLTRLRSWGFTFLRFLVTWEAIEHAGPGIYDQEYLDYIEQVVCKAAEYDIQLFIDPHEDVWSRFSGGDGAPGWTFETAGLDIEKFVDTQAAIVHATHGNPYPRMIWSTNCGRLAAATMYTLFFGGNDFAPRTTLDGEPIQEFLQRHYINSIKQLAERLKKYPNVVGYDIMNEPYNGFIGHSLSKRINKMPFVYSPSIWQTILLGAGFPQKAGLFKTGITGNPQKNRHILNSQKTRAWLDNRQDIWFENGVWKLDASGQPYAPDPEYFTKAYGKKVDFYRDYFKPFANRFSKEIRAIDPRAIIFVEGIPSESENEQLTWDDREDASDVVYAAHWYDNITLVLKRFIPWLNIDIYRMKLVPGPKNVQKMFYQQMAKIRQLTQQHMGERPILLGEFGIPYDMNNKQAYRTGNFSSQINALDFNFRAIEANLFHCTLWNYTADNTNQYGDLWNDEDLSIFSKDQKIGDGSLDDGGRALKAVIRPYPRATAGEPLQMSFDIHSRVFWLKFKHDPAVFAPTEIFLPAYHYPNGCNVKLSDGSYEIISNRQILIYHHTQELETHSITIEPR